MTNIATGTAALVVQHARADRMRDLLEPWSLRKLEARTGLGRNYLQSRLNGTTALSISDVEVLAPVIRMTPADLFAELLSVNDEKAPTPKGGGDVNMRTTDYKYAPTSLAEYRARKAV